MPNDKSVKGFLAYLYNQFVENPANQMRQNVETISGRMGNTTPQTFPGDLAASGLAALGILGSPFDVARPVTRAVGQATHPAVGEAADLAIAMPVGGGVGAGRWSSLSKMGAEARRAAQAEAGFGRVAPQVLQRSTMPTPKELGTVNQLIADVKQFGLPGGVRRQYEGLVASRIGVERAKALPDADLMSYIDAYDLWPRIPLNEAPREALVDLAKKGHISFDQVEEALGQRGTINEQFVKDLQKKYPGK